MSVKILKKVNSEEYNKQNEIVFKSIPEFLEGESWHWNQAGGDDESGIDNFWDYLKFNFKLTKKEIGFLQKKKLIKILR